MCYTNTKFKETVFGNFCDCTIITIVYHECVTQLNVENPIYNLYHIKYLSAKLYHKLYQWSKKIIVIKI